MSENSTQERETVFQRVAGGLSRWSARWVPDAWVIVVLLTFVVFILAFFLSPAELEPGKAGDLIEGWGRRSPGTPRVRHANGIDHAHGIRVVTSPPVPSLLDLDRLLAQGTQERNCGHGRHQH